MTIGSLDQPIQMLHQRRFSGPGMANNSHELPIRYLQINIIQGLYRQWRIFPIHIIHMF